MICLTLISPYGGVGRTTLLAHLATAFARLQRTVLALDFDPQNSLGLHFGLDPRHEDGMVSSWLHRRDWHASGLWADGIRLLTFGAASAAELRGFEHELLRRPKWLANELTSLDLPEDTVVLIDTPTFASVYAQQAILASTLCAGVLRLDALAPLSMARLDAAMPIGYRMPMILNGVDPTIGLSNAIADVLRAQFRDRVANAVIHFDQAINDALAADASLFDFAPHSQAAHDLHGLSRWLLARLDAQAEVAA